MLADPLTIGITFSEIFSICLVSKIKISLEDVELGCDLILYLKGDICVSYLKLIFRCCFVFRPCVFLCGFGIVLKIQVILYILRLFLQWLTENRKIT